MDPIAPGTHHPGLEGWVPALRRWLDDDPNQPRLVIPVPLRLTDWVQNDPDRSVRTHTFSRLRAVWPAPSVGRFRLVWTGLVGVDDLGRQVASDRVELVSVTYPATGRVPNWYLPCPYCELYPTLFGHQPDQAGRFWCPTA